MSSRLTNPGSLISHFPLNNHAEDVIRGNDGAWVSTEAYAEGPFGRSVADFGGTGQYVSVPNSDAFSFGNSVTDSPFSMSFWIIRDVVGVADGLIEKSSAGSVAEYTIAITSGNAIRCQLFDATNSNAIGRDAAAAVMEAGRPYFCVITYDGSAVSGGISTYVNNVKKDSGNVTAGSYTAMHNQATPFLIGRRVIPSAQHIDGKMWDVRVHNFVLTAQERKTLFLQPVPRG